MNQTFREEWTTELRTGDRKQSRCRLGRVNDDGTEMFCCLGVAMDLLSANGFCEKRVEDNDLITYSYVYHDDNGVDKDCWEKAVLTLSAADHIGVSVNPLFTLPDDGKTYGLAELNDAGFTFEQIADVIDYFFKD